MKINSKRVKQLRIENSWSQEQLSAASGLSLRTIQRIEITGQASLDSIRALATAFGVEPSELQLSPGHESPSPAESIKSTLREFANFEGTATRFEYWWFFLFTLLIAAIAAILAPQALKIVSVVVLLPFLAVGTRRLNAAGHSGWWQLLFLVPFGFVLVLILLAQEGEVDSGFKQM